MLIVNPSSGNEAAMDHAAYVKKQLYTIFDEVQVKYTEKKWDAARFSKQASQEKYEALFALGGDGTVNECINGIAEEEYRPKFGFIPMGTVNDLGRVLGIPMNPKDAIEQIPEMVLQEIDVGRANETYFVDVLAVGTIPEAVHEVPVEKKTRLGPFAYILEGIKSLKENETHHFRIQLDEETNEFESFLVLVALTNSVAGFQTMIPEAEVDDGRLHCLALIGDKIVDKLDILPKVFTGKVTEDERVLYRPFKQGRIQVSEKKKVTVNIDGDEGDALPVTLEILPRHISCFVTKK